MHRLTCQNRSDPAASQLRQYILNAHLLLEAQPSHPTVPKSPCKVPGGGIGLAQGWNFSALLLDPWEVVPFESLTCKCCPLIVPHRPPGARTYTSSKPLKACYVNVQGRHTR